MYTLKTERNKSPKAAYRDTDEGRKTKMATPFFNKGTTSGEPSFFSESNVIQRQTDKTAAKCYEERKSYFENLAGQIKSAWDDKIDCNDPQYMDYFQTLVRELEAYLHTYQIPASELCCSTIYKFQLFKNTIETELPKAPEPMKEMPLGEPLDIKQENNYWKWDPMPGKEQPSAPPPEQQEKDAAPSQPEKEEIKGDAPKEPPKEEPAFDDPCKPFVHLERYYAGYDNLKNLFEEQNEYSVDIQIKGSTPLTIKFFEGFITMHPECALA